MDSKSKLTSRSNKIDEFNRVASRLQQEIMVDIMVDKIVMAFSCRDDSFGFPG